MDNLFSSQLNTISISTLGKFFENENNKIVNEKIRKYTNILSEKHANLKEIPEENFECLLMSPCLNNDINIENEGNQPKETNQPRENHKKSTFTSPKMKRKYFSDSILSSSINKKINSFSKYDNPFKKEHFLRKKLDFSFSFENKQFQE